MSAWFHESMTGLDLETTSALPETAIPVSFALVRAHGSTIEKARHGLVKPGIPIPDEARKIHGISDADCEERGGELDKTILGIAGELMLCSETRKPVVAYNAVFDLTIVDRHYQRIQGCSLAEDGWNGIVIDPLVLDRHADKWRKGSRKLTAVCEHYGVELDRAHTAAADAVAAVQLAVAIAEKHAEIGHADAEVLHMLQKAWHRTWYDDYQAYRAEKGQEPLSEEEADWPIRGLA